MSLLKSPLKSLLTSILTGRSKTLLLSRMMTQTWKTLS